MSYTIKLQCLQGDVMSMEQEIMSKDPLVFDDSDETEILNHLFTYQIWKQHQQPLSKDRARNIKKPSWEKIVLGDIH